MYLMVLQITTGTEPQMSVSRRSLSLMICSLTRRENPEDGITGTLEHEARNRDW